MRAAYRAVLCSPSFLFLVEQPGRLTDHALASRLSYFLWRSCPDESLTAIADRGELHRQDVLRQQTERLLASPKSAAFVNDFLDHWLKLCEITATTPDRELFPEYFENVYNNVQDRLLHYSLIAETRCYFTDLLQTNGSVAQLVDSDYTFLNNRLAQHYGLPPIEGVQLRKVALPPDSDRGGVITHASVLKVTANGSTTSPVLRGAWLLENILGRPTPPPPPNAGSIEPDTRGATTVREQLMKHQADPSCASCHRQIDPPGFALEAFDPIGQSRSWYRTSEQGEKVDMKFFHSSYRPVKYLRGSDVDATGQFPDGRTFDGPQQCKQQMAADAPAIARCLASKLVTFATGKSTEPGDVQALDQIIESTRQDDYGLRSIAHAIVQSRLFTHK
jgi:hypothetical protein